jgi:PDZ domain-containing protein
VDSFEDRSSAICQGKRMPHPLPTVRLGLSWLVVLPACAWGLVNLFLPVFGGPLSPLQTWTVILAAAIAAVLSLVCHFLAHWGMAWVTGASTPGRMTLLISADAAQGWAASGSASSEALVTLAGPAASLLLAVLGYLAWNAQINPLFSLCMLFASAFNGWLFVINLIPCFPLDGGRLMRLALGGPAPSRAQASRTVMRLGVAVPAGLAVWSAFLFAQHSRFSPETAAVTGVLALVILDGMRAPPAAKPGVSSQSAESQGEAIRRLIGASLVGLVLAALPLSLLLTNNGLEAPGVALPVEPMVNLPVSYRHPHSGELLLTTVVSQAPITAGEWLVAQFDPAFQVVLPETVVPANTSLQKQAQQNYQMLNDSETTAIAVGLRLAGYSSVAVGRGAQVVSTLPGSHAAGLLQPGDIITGVNGISIQTTTDLISQIKAQAGASSLHLTVRRGTDQLEFEVSFLPPSSPGSAPRLGIEVEPAGFDYHPPFPISIVTQKITGGPSAGLMFSLAVYNVLSPSDLTGGRRIAGTGTIDLDGTVGPVGGVKQKVIAAEAMGATYFLCPVDNYNAALSVARTITVVKIATAQQAVAFLQSLPPR